MAICSAIFAIVCAAGFVRVETKNKVTELWVPQDTPIMRSREHVEASFGAAPSWMAIIVRKVGSETAALSPEIVELMFDLEALIDQLPMRHEVCLHSSTDPAPGGRCVHRGVTNLWCNRTQYEAEVGSKPDPAVALVDVVNSRAVGCLGMPIEKLRVFGSPTYDDGSTFRSAVPGVSRIIGAVYASSWYLLDVAKARESAVGAHCRAFERLMRREQSRLAAEGWEVEFAYQEAFDDEIARSVTGDIPLVIASFTFTLVAAVMSQMHLARPELGAATQASSGLACVALSVFAGYGIVIFFGVPFTSLSLVGIFILLGVGVDDVLVLLESFRLARITIPDGGTVEERARFATERAGVSITITSATNIIAFSLGSMTVIPAVNWFCAYMACAILFDFLLCLTLFMAVIVWHERRDQAKGLPAIAYKKSAAETVPLPGLETPNNSGSTIAKVVDGEVKAVEKATRRRRTWTAGLTCEGVFRGQHMRAYGNFLMLTPVRALVVCGFLAFGMSSLLLMSRIEEGLPRTSLAPDDSFLIGFFSIFDTTYQAQEGLTLDLHVHGVDHSSPEIQARVMAAWGMHLQSGVIEPLHKPNGGWMVAQNTPLDSRYSSPRSWLTVVTQVAIAANATAPCRALGVSPRVCAAAAVPYRLADDSLTDDFDPPLVIRSAFNATLNEALELVPSMSDRLIRRHTDGVLVASIVGTKAVPVAGQFKRQLDIYKECIRLDEAINAEVFTGAEVNAALTPYVTTGVSIPNLRVFTFNNFLVYWQQDAVLKDELVTNLTFAGLGVLIVCMIALAHPAALIAVSGVGIVDIFLFGSLIIGGIRFNVISVVNFVMAVGLAVDYTLHFCHAFLAQPGANRITRVKYALNTMGDCILKGGGTTLVGTLPMAFSTSTIFRVFFALLFSTILYGLAVGLVLLPVVLSVIPMPPAPHLKHDYRDWYVDPDRPPDGV